MGFWKGRRHPSIMAFAYYPTAWAFCSDLNLTPPERLVLLRLADASNEEGMSWYSQPRIAADTGLGERSVRRALNVLEHTHGLIERTPRPGTSTLTYLRIPKAMGADRVAGVGRPESPGTPATVAYEPRKEPRRENLSSKRAKALA